MPGTWRDLIWQHNPTLDAPPRYRKACRYRAFLPERLAQLRFTLDADTAGAVSQAEQAIAGLNCHITISIAAKVTSEVTSGR